MAEGKSTERWLNCNEAHNSYKAWDAREFLKRWMCSIWAVEVHVNQTWWCWSVNLCTIFHSYGTEDMRKQSNKTNLIWVLMSAFRDKSPLFPMRKDHEKGDSLITDTCTWFWQEKWTDLWYHYKYYWRRMILILKIKVVMFLQVMRA